MQRELIDIAEIQKPSSDGRYNSHWPDAMRRHDTPGRSIEIFSWGGNLLYLQRAVVAIVTLFPVLFMTTERGANGSFYLLLLCGLVALGIRSKPAGKRFTQVLRDTWPLSLAMCGYLIAVFANQWSMGHFVGSAYEMPFQFACFPLLLWVMLTPPASGLKTVQWGLIAATLVCTAAVYIGTVGGTDRPLFILGVPLIPFGNIAMMMGVLAFLSIGWDGGGNKLVIVLKVVAGAAALYGSYLSQTRGSWLALPLFAAIAFSIFGSRNMRWRLGFFLLVAALLGGVYLASEPVQRRVAEANSDIHRYVEGTEKNTPVGLRLQLWQASWVLFKEHPLFGIGRDRYPQEAQQLVQRHVLTPEAALQPHTHSDVLFHATTMGIFGLLAMLAMYFVPAACFYRDIGSADRETRTMAGMGLAFTLGFFVFGLTDVMFFWKVSFPFYAILLPWLFACLMQRKTLLEGS